MLIPHNHHHDANPRSHPSEDHNLWHGGFLDPPQFSFLFRLLPTVWHERKSFAQYGRPRKQISQHIIKWASDLLHSFRLQNLKQLWRHDARRKANFLNTTELATMKRFDVDIDHASSLFRQRGINGTGGSWIFAYTQGVGHTYVLQGMLERLTNQSFDRSSYNLSL